jgi:hypothetical protein
LSVSALNLSTKLRLPLVLVPASVIVKLSSVKVTLSAPGKVIVVVVTPSIWPASSLAIPVTTATVPPAVGAAVASLTSLKVLVACSIFNSLSATVAIICLLSSATVI